MQGGVTHDCASILDSTAKELLVSTIFCMVHPYIAFLHLLHIFFALRSYAHAHVNATPRMI